MTRFLTHAALGSTIVATLATRALAEEPQVEPDEAMPAPQATPATPTPTNSTTGSERPTPSIMSASQSQASPQKVECPPCDEPDAEGFGEFILGAGLFDWSNLNDRLAANGYERVPDVMTLIGGEGRAVLASGFVIGARGAAIMSPDGEGPGDFTRSFGGGFGMLDLGIALVHTRPFLLTATTGIGGYGVSVDISEETTVPFDQVLSNPERGASLSIGGVLGALTLAFDVRVPVGSADRGRQAYFSMGARLGGMYGPPMSDWSLSPDRSATSSPSQSLLGGYTALAIGFGGGKPLAEQ